MASSSSVSRSLTSSKEMAVTPPQLPPGGWDVFLSHSGEQKGFARDLYAKLSPFYNVFFDVNRDSLPLGENFPKHIFYAAETCKVALVVLSDKFFCSKWPMLELCKFFEASKVQVMPLFFKLSPGNLSDKVQDWHKSWEKFESEDGRRIKASSCSNACRRLRSLNGPVYKEENGLMAYLDDIEKAISQKIPCLFRSSPDVVHGRDHLCQILIDKFEELESKPLNPPTNLSRVSILGVYGVSGSGKSTLCACLRDRFYLSFNRHAVHVNLPTDPTPTQLLEEFKKLLKETNVGKYKEGKMMSEIQNVSMMVNALNDSNLGSLRVFLVIDNITSKDSMELVEAILGVGVGAGSRVVLAAQSSEVLRPPLLNLPMNVNNHVCYVCAEMRVPSLNREEAVSMLLQHACSQETAEQLSFSHRENIGKFVQKLGLREESSPPYGDAELLYLPIILKLVGVQLKSNEMDLKRLQSMPRPLQKELKKDAVEDIVRERFERLPEKLKLLFQDMVFFVIRHSRYRTKGGIDFELLVNMHDCSLYTIKRDLNELRRLGFLEGSNDEFLVHDLILQYVSSILQDASSMYYYTGRSVALEEVMFKLTVHTPGVHLRVLILEGLLKCERLAFPADLMSVKVIIVRKCMSLEILGLASLQSLVSLEIENCPCLELVQLGPSHVFSLKRVSCALVGKSKRIVFEQPQHESSLHESQLPKAQAGRHKMPVKWLKSVAHRVGHHRSTLDAELCHHRTFVHGLGAFAKALQVVRLEMTGIRSLGDLSSCWPQLRVLEVYEGHLEVLELGNLPNLKQFYYGYCSRDVFFSENNASPNEQSPYWMQSKNDTKVLLRDPNLLAGCAGLEDVRICRPSYEDGMVSLKWPSNLSILWLKEIHRGEPVPLECSASAHSLDEIVIYDHRVLPSVKFTCEFLKLVSVTLIECSNVVTITGLEWLPELERLSVTACGKLQSLQNIEGLTMLKTLHLRSCPILALSLQTLSCQNLLTLEVWDCPNVQFLGSSLENLTEVRKLQCNVWGSMLKLKYLVNLEVMCIDWKREGQVSTPLALCSHDDEENSERFAQEWGIKYMPLFVVVGKAAAPPLSELTIGGVQNLVYLDGINCFSTLSGLTLQDLPKLTSLQGLQSLVHLQKLTVHGAQSLVSLDGIRSTLRKLQLEHLPQLTDLQALESLSKLTLLFIAHCNAVKELPSLCSLGNVVCLEIRDCVNIIRLEGLPHMRSLTWARFDGCEKLELSLDALEQLHAHHLSFRGCKFASIQAMLGWVLDEKVSHAVLDASFNALHWELQIHLLEKPTERRELAEHLVETFLKSQLALAVHNEDCFNFKPWIEYLQWTHRRLHEEGVSFPRELEELMGKQSTVPVRELLQQWQSDAQFRASAAKCILEVHPRLLHLWIGNLVLNPPLGVSLRSLHE